MSSPQSSSSVAFDATKWKVGESKDLGVRSSKVSLAKDSILACIEANEARPYSKGKRELVANLALLLAITTSARGVEAWVHMRKLLAANPVAFANIKLTAIDAATMTKINEKIATSLAALGKGNKGDNGKMRSKAIVDAINSVVPAIAFVETFGDAGKPPMIVCSEAFKEDAILLRTIYLMRDPVATVTVKRVVKVLGIERTLQWTSAQKESVIQQAVRFHLEAEGAPWNKRGAAASEVGKSMSFPMIMLPAAAVGAKSPYFGNLSETAQISMLFASSYDKLKAFSGKKFGEKLDNRLKIDLLLFICRGAKADVDQVLSSLSAM